MEVDPKLADRRDILTIVNESLEITGMAQDPVYGGIHIHYRVIDGRFEIAGDMNAETTSIIVIALYGTPLKPSSRIHNKQDPSTTLIISALVTITIALYTQYTSMKRKVRALSNARTP